MTERHKSMSEVFKAVYGPRPRSWDYLSEDLDFILSAKRKALGIPDEMLDSQLPYNGRTDPLFEIVKSCLLPVVGDSFDSFKEFVEAAKRLIFAMKDMHDNGWFDIHILEEANDAYLTISATRQKPNMQYFTRNWPPPEEGKIK